MRPHPPFEVRFMEQRELEESYPVKVVMEKSETVYQEMRDIKCWEKEVFVAFYLDTRRQVISREILSIGTVDSAVIHPREVFRTAIMRNASAVIIAHNHPSGGLEPSDEDMQVTRQLKEAGRIIGIQLLDHVIVTREGHYSFDNKGML